MNWLKRLLGIVDGEECLSARLCLLEAALAVDFWDWVHVDYFVGCLDPHWFIDSSNGVEVIDFDWQADALPLAYAIAEHIAGEGEV